MKGFTEEDQRQKTPLLPGQIRIELVYNPNSLSPYEVRISDPKHASSEDAFKTLQGAFAYMDYLDTLKRDYQIVYRGQKHPMWVTFAPRFLVQYEELGSWRSRPLLFYKEQYAEHRTFLNEVQA